MSNISFDGMFPVDIAEDDLDHKRHEYGGGYRDIEEFGIGEGIAAYMGYVDNSLPDNNEVYTPASNATVRNFLAGDDVWDNEMSDPLSGIDRSYDDIYGYDDTEKFYEEKYYQNVVHSKINGVLSRRYAPGDKNKMYGCKAKRRLKNALSRKPQTCTDPIKKAYLMAIRRKALDKKSPMRGSAKRRKNQRKIGHTHSGDAAMREETLREEKKRVR